MGGGGAGFLTDRKNMISFIFFLFKFHHLQKLRILTAVCRDAEICVSYFVQVLLIAWLSAKLSN